MFEITRDSLRSHGEERDCKGWYEIARDYAITRDYEMIRYNEITEGVTCNIKV